MVKLNRIYTKTGEGGTTGLGDGTRVTKFDLRVEAFGTVDEANATLGLVRLHTAGDAELDAILARIQNDLFDLGADLCTPDTGAKLEWEPLRMVETQVSRLESELDALNGRLKPLSSFILPGGSPAAAYLHLASTGAATTPAPRPARSERRERGMAWLHLNNRAMLAHAAITPQPA